MEESKQFKSADFSFYFIVLFIIEKQTNEQKEKKRSADEVDDDDYIPQLSPRKKIKGLPVKHYSFP